MHEIRIRPGKAAFPPAGALPVARNDNMPPCDWPSLEEQLLAQWYRLTRSELEAAGPDCARIAELVQRKYGISAALVRNYLHNLARTLPTQERTGAG